MGASAVGKPGTNWTQVSPENRKKVAPLVRHWMKKKKPFTECVRELGPEKGEEAAKRICAVVKDMGMRTTKWRKGGKHKVSEAPVEDWEALVDEAWDDVIAPALDEGGVTVDELAAWSEVAVAAGVLEAVEFDPDDLVETARVLEASKATPMSHSARRPGESMAAHGRRLKRADAALAAKGSTSSSKTRAGKNASFEAQHPRGRGGSWTFKQGHQGPGVKVVQQRVGVQASGTYDKSTVEAVKAFQKRHGLQVDGVVGAQTIAAMAGDKQAAKIKPGVASHADRQKLHAMRRRQKARRQRVQQAELAGVTFKPSELVQTARGVS